MKTDLTQHEATELLNLEDTIAAGLSTFLEVGRALQAIREKRLYRSTHPTFEAYCREKWDFSGRRARQLIGAAKFVESGTNGSTPQNERQARQEAMSARIFASLSMERQKQVIEEQEAAAKADDAGVIMEIPPHVYVERGTEKLQAGLRLWERGGVPPVTIAAVEAVIERVGRRLKLTG